VNTRRCPPCNADLRGENIYEYFLSYYKGNESEAKRAADCYGGDGYFYRTIGIYSMELDRTTHYRCPDCNKEWGR
jgi:uncharacterized protein with PIN domain